MRKLALAPLLIGTALLGWPAAAQFTGSTVPLASSTVTGKVKCDGGVTTSCAADGTITAVGAATGSVDAGGATAITNGTNGDILTQAAGKVSHSTLASGSNGIVVSGTTISQTNVANTQSGTLYDATHGDGGNLTDCTPLAQKTTVLTNASSAVTVTLPNVSQTGCGAGATFSFESGGTTPQQVTINVTSPSLIRGASSYTLGAGQSILLADPDGLNYTAIATLPLASAHIFIGQTGSVAADTAVTGDVTITAGGVTAIGANKVTTTTINAGAVTEAKIALADNTTDNVSTSAHGFTPKGDNNAAHFLNGQLGWTTPAGGSGSPGGSDTQLQYDNAGAFGGIAGATTDGTAVTFAAGDLKLNGSGGANQFVKQSTANAAVTVGSIGTADLPGSGATTVNGQSCMLNSTCHIISVLTGSDTTGSGGSQTTIYTMLSGSSSQSTTETNREGLAPAAVTLGNANGQGGFYCRVVTAPGAGNSISFTLRKNEADTTVVCNITDTNTSASDTTHSASYVAGDRWAIKVVGTNNAASGNDAFGVTVQQ